MAQREGPSPTDGPTSRRTYTCTVEGGGFPACLETKAIQGLIRQPHVCPVCQGRKSLPHGFYGPSPGTNDEPCEACTGIGGEPTGIVWG